MLFFFCGSILFLISTVDIKITAKGEKTVYWFVNYIFTEEAGIAGEGMWVVKVSGNTAAFPFAEMDKSIKKINPEFKVIVFKNFFIVTEESFIEYEKLKSLKKPITLKGG